MGHPGVRWPVGPHLNTAYNSTAVTHSGRLGVPVFLIGFGEGKTPQRTGNAPGLSYYQCQCVRERGRVETFTRMQLHCGEGA